MTDRQNGRRLRDKVGASFSAGGMIAFEAEMALVSAGHAHPFPVS